MALRSWHPDNARTVARGALGDVEAALAQAPVVD